MEFRRAVVVGLLAAIATGGMARAGPRVEPSTAIVTRLAAEEWPHLKALYEDIHAHPELGFQETRTAAILAAEMRGLGFEVTEGVGKTGLVALYRNGPGPVVMVRTELDALPMEEKTGLPYASRASTIWQGEKTFVAHSCGHDVHMAAWVGTAKALIALKGQWHGTLMFVAQPDEEGDRGAKAMLADGLFTRFPRPDYALALHASPTAFGTAGYRTGPIMSSSDTVKIVFHGRGGHGAAPQATIDPIVIAAHFISDLQTIVSREKDPSAFGVATIGAIQGGTVGNIIPDQVTLRGTLRSYDPAVRQLLTTGVRRMVLASAALAGAPTPEVTIEDSLGAVINPPKLGERLIGVLNKAFGPRVAEIPPVTASEDFSEYGAAGIPSFYYFIGVYDPRAITADASRGEAPPGNHSPQFAPVEEPTITFGVESMSVLVLDLLHR